IFAGINSLSRIANLKPKDTSHGSAHFAERRDIKHLLRSMIKPVPAGELLIGIYIETWRPTHKYLNLNRDMATRHSLVLGPTGVGKSRAIFLPNCHYNNGGSFIATDPKSELWNYTSGSQFNPIRFAPREPDASAGFNFVPACRDIKVAKRVVLSIVYAEGIEKGDRFWNNGERQLLTAVISHVAH